jgi:3-hydroxybutyryl-CoA dehydrogenase
VGLDVNLAVSTSVWEQMSRHARFTPHEIQRNLVEQGHLGRKTGRGFYLHDGSSALPAVPVDRKSFQLNPLMSDAMLAFCVRAGAIEATGTEQYVLSRILAAILNEAGHAYTDGIATSDDIDIAMVKGTNYPAGPLAWADEIGHRTVRGVLRALNQSVSDGRYEAAKLFAEAT